MASLLRTLNFVTASINPGASSSTNQTIVGNICDIVKIKVVPSNINPGELTSVYIYKHNTFSAADLVYSTASFSGNLIDPIETDGTTSTERNEGFIAKYEDLDGAQQLHIKVTNSGTVAKTYTVTIEYISIVDIHGGTNVLSTSDFDGADAAAKISNAIAALPAAGGVVDARSLQGAQNWSTTVTINKPVTLLLGITAITYTANPAIAITANNVAVKGVGWSSVLAGSGNANAGITIGTNLTGVLLEDFRLIGTGAGSTAIGITFTNTYNSFVSRLYVSLFNYGVRYAPGANSSYLNTIKDSQIISNNITNIDAQAATNFLTLYNVTFGGGPAQRGLKMVDSSGLAIYGGDVEGTSKAPIEIDNTGAFLYGNVVISNMDFESNDNADADIYIGRTNAITGVLIEGCQFHGGTNELYPVNLFKANNVVLLANSVTSGYLSSSYPFYGTVTNVTSTGNRWPLPNFTHFSGGGTGDVKIGGTNTTAPLTALEVQGTGITTPIMKEPVTTGVWFSYSAPDTRFANLNAGGAIDFRNNGNSASILKLFDNGSSRINGGGYIVSQAGAPGGGCTTGSIYLRTDGGAGSTLYVCEGGGWVAK